MERDRSSNRSERGGRESSREERGGGRDRERSSGRESEDRGGRSGRGGGRGSSDFVYQKRSADTIKKRQDDMNSGNFDKYLTGDVKTFTPADGDNCIRILPPTWENADHYGYDIWVHYSVGPDNQTYLCLNKMKGEPCPVCEERRRAVADGDTDYAKELEPKQRVLIALIDREDEKEGPQLWAMPWSVDKDLMGRQTDKRTGDTLSLDDPDSGYDVEFEKTGKAQKTKYIGISLSRRESELGNAKWLDWIAANPLPTCLKFYAYDHIAQQFGGGSSKGGGSDRDTGRDRGGRDEQDEDLKRVERGGSRRDTADADTMTWDQVHSMTFDELASIVDAEGLKIEVNDSANDDELADWICEDLKIQKRAEAPARRRVAEEPESSDDKLAAMRRRRSE